MEDASTLLKIPKSECPDIWIRLPRHKWPKSWSRMEDLVVPLESEFVRSSFGRTVMGKAIRESSTGTRLGESSKIGNVSIRYIVKKDYSYLCMWTYVKMAGKKQNLDPMRQVLMKDVDVGEPTSFLGVVLNEIVTQAKILWTIVAICENPKSLLELPYSEKLGANISSWSHDIESHAKKCVERYCELANDSTAIQNHKSMH